MSLFIMYKTRNGEKNNLSGHNIAKIRKAIIPALSQRALADKLQLRGIDLDKNAIQRIECGKRFITDIELLGFSEVLEVTVDELLSNSV